MEFAAFLAATLIGLSLGMIGAGGSILTVPVLVYLAGVDPVLATGYSLFVVGSTALIGGIKSARQGMVDFRTAAIFGLPSILAVYATRLWLMPLIPDQLLSIGSFTLSKGTGLLLLFAVLMILTSVSMIRDKKEPDAIKAAGSGSRNVLYVLGEGVGVGVLTGMVGAGGGFLIIPALVLLAGLEMKIAVGTSLFIIAAKSLFGFVGDIQNGEMINWPFLALFTGFSVAGIFAGSWLAGYVNGNKLKKAFGWFVLVMGVYMVVREIMFA
jgi:uncharacterized membrane protein YfcA